MDDARYRITILDTGETYACRGSTTVLKAMTQLGRKGIPSGCHGGGCGICKVRVVSGFVTTLPMSRSQVSEAEEAVGYALACRCYPCSDVDLKVVGRMQRAVKRPFGFV